MLLEKNTYKENDFNGHKSQNCPRCGRHTIIYDNDTGEIICGLCGFVISEKIVSHEPERIFSEDVTSNKRTGEPLTLTRHDMGVSTIMNSSGKDALGKTISPMMKNSLKRLKVLNSRISSYPNDRNLIAAFSELNKLKDKLNLSSSIIELAAYIYRKAVENKLIRGRMISSILAASLYTACRYTQTPRTIRDVSKTMNLPRKEVTKCYRLLLREFELNMPILDPTKYISRIGNNLRVSEKTKRLAIKLLQSAAEKRIATGKDPMGLAAASLYLSCVETKERHSQRDVAKAANITEVTIRNRSKSLKLLLKH